MRELLVEFLAFAEFVSDGFHGGFQAGFCDGI
jgi:hypothetical protein